MSGELRQYVVLCEGYDDRSFWRGWLLHLGCTDPTDRGRTTALDARGDPVRGQGRFLLRTPGGSDLVIKPYHGRNNARDAVAEYLGGRQPHPPDEVIFNLDSDAEDHDASTAEDQIRGIARYLGADADGAGPFAIGGSLLHAVVWRCDDPEAVAGVPRKQTLERLVSAGIRAAYPDRGPAVETWLEMPPQGLTLPRSFAFSYYAKWHADHGAADFYASVWRDERVAEELTRRLTAIGAMGIVDSVVRERV